ncbi:MAG: LysM peptidoglycan-binding domain-containing protein [Proteobacteria bacterium]|uniref:LysM peptidoglycan-binding domain-containing protein n=1 Tax=Rudaea sp. TaxID=2136325 RepID=UPI0032206C84|nr:LysM peptidoglycan-binding domain-containing protein [Pseudomonadota bacterium]
MPSEADSNACANRRERRLLTLSACCTALGSAFILLAACSTPVVRHAAVVPPPPQAGAVPDLVIEPKAPRLAPATPASPWPRLRARYALPGCDYSPTVRQFATQIASSPAHLSAAFKEAMPLLLLVTEQIEKYDMPGEFAFLPWVESSYNMIPARGDGVAGMWQLMPFTARESGLRVDGEYDGRLDVVASSRTALALIKQYKESFGDWRLANMAFNAGENSVRAALGKRRSITPAEIAKLRLNQVNYEHLIKLLAVSCIVSAPERYRVELPEPDANDALSLLELPAPLDLHLAAQLAGIGDAELQRLNSAYLKARMPERGPFHLLVPAQRRAAIEQTLAMLPKHAWQNWREVRLQQPQNLDTLGLAYDVDAAALAQINHIGATGTTLPAGTRLTLPGRGSEVPAVAALAPPAATNAAAASKSAPSTASATEDTCTVRSGDTLWQIANRYGVRMEDLLHWNRLSRNTTLRLGQKLVLNAPAREAAK